jgi:hypothetical protein
MNSLSRQRATRRDAILSYFCAHVGERFPTADMHFRFGSAFRSRCSELNRSETSPITIHNHVERLPDGTESSCYWAEWKNSQPTIAWAQTSVQESLFGDTSATPEYPD